MKKFKMLTTIASIAMCLAVMVFGVMAANQVTFSVTSTISYAVQDVFVDIETKVYSSNLAFQNYDELAYIAEGVIASAENGGFEQLESSAIDPDGFGRLTSVIINQGSETPDLYKFTSTSPSDIPAPLALDLQYSTEGNGIYSYFMVIKVTNLGSIPLYSFVKNNDYVAPGENNLAYKQDGYIELQNRNDYGYIVFAIGIEDITENVPESTFNFPIEVAKELPNDFFTTGLRLSRTESIYHREEEISTSESYQAIANVERLDTDMVVALLNMRFYGEQSDIVLEFNSDDAEIRLLPMAVAKHAYTYLELCMFFEGATEQEYDQYMLTPTVEDNVLTISANEGVCDVAIPILLKEIVDDKVLDSMTMGISITTQTEDVYFIRVEHKNLDCVLDSENIAQPIHIWADDITADGMNCDYFYAELKGIETDLEYIKIYSEDLDVPDFGFDIVIINHEFMENYANENGNWPREECCYLVADWVSRGKDDNLSGFYVDGSLDENGYYSWLIPIEELVSGSLSFEFIILCGGSGNVETYDFSIAYTIVDGK